MIRKPAVTGTFYPSNPKELEQMVKRFIFEAETRKIKNLKAIISPHAGYIYSGPVAGSAYKQLLSLPSQKYNVFLLGPAHYVFTTAAVGMFDEYETPLGKVKVNLEICSQLLEQSSEVEDNIQAHLPEHSLEVQLPFLQQSLNNFEIIPILLGDTSISAMTELLNPYFLANDSLFVISSDLSHYKNYYEAEQTDQNTLNRIISLDTKNMDEIDACGSVGIKILMNLAKNNSYTIDLLDYRNSGDTAGDKKSVVGYSACAIHK